MAEKIDYDYKPDSGGGKFLNLKAKGDAITVRLADKPIVYFVHWLDDKPVICADKTTCQTCIIVAGFTPDEMKKKENAQLKRRQTFVWPVIDRADGVAKIFKGGTGIFLSIAQFANDPKWGGAEKSATKFDVTITRTETSLQNFYSVVPDPSSLKVELTKEEKEDVEKLSTLIDSLTASEDVEPEEIPEKPADEFIAGLEADKGK